MNNYSPTITGFSANMGLAYAKYELNAAHTMCSMSYNFSSDGTSNSTLKTITLAYAAKNSGNATAVCRTVNGTTKGTGYLITTAGSNVAKVFIDMSGNSWGLAAARFQPMNFEYEIYDQNAKQIFFMGASLMNYSQGLLVNGMRFSTTCYNTIVGTNPGCMMQNYSVGAKSTTDMLNNFSTELQPYLKSGDIVFFGDGVANDYGIAGMTDALAYQNVQDYAALVIAAGGQFIYSSTCPSVGLFETNKLTVDGFVNANYISLGFSAYCDFRSIAHCQVVADCSNTTYWETDGKHHKDILYDAKAAYAAPIITPFL